MRAEARTSSVDPPRPPTASSSTEPPGQAPDLVGQPLLSDAGREGQAGRQVHGRGVADGGSAAGGPADGFSDRCRGRRPRPARSRRRRPRPGRVAQPELGEDARHMRLHGGRSDEEPLGDLGVARPRATATTTSRSRSVRRSRRRATAWSTVRRSNWPMRRRVIDGASSAPPSATVRTAVASSAGRMSLSTKPLAPARSAW